MDDEPSVPEFTLPAWGEDGAPPEPAAGTDGDLPGEELEIRVEHQILVTTMPLPSTWSIETIHGLVTALGRSSAGDLPDATEKATRKALTNLDTAARQLGATAVTGLRLSTVSRKGLVVVTAYGTAVSVNR